MKPFSRREFLKTSLLTTASVGLWPALSGCQTQRRAAPLAARLRVRGANEDIRVAVVGFGGRGRDHIKNFRELKGVRVVALCDVDSEILAREIRHFKDRGEPIEGYTDYRRLLENKDIDVVSLGTPNHWHALGSIWAVQAGLDVYVEKPVSHNVWEGRKIVEAARKYHRIVQTGTQSRSSSGLNEAIRWLQAGNLGKLKLARGLCYKRRPSIGKIVGSQPIAPSVDYDQWLGPAPWEPLRRAKLHYDWHWVWATGNGDLGNQGVHQMDIARWAMGEQALSPRVFSVGGRLGYEDDGETPNTMIVFHDYPTAPLIFEVRGLPAEAGSEKMDKYRDASVGVVLDYEGGYVDIPNYSSAIIHDEAGKEIRKFSGGGNHYENFIKAVRSRRHTDLNADILEGHLSSALCHTGNISYRLGQPLPPESIRDAFKDNRGMAETFGRMEEHLAANNVDLRHTPATLGEVLNMNPATERFVSNRKANQLLTREYRKPFVVPERV